MALSCTTLQRATVCHPLTFEVREYSRLVPLILSILKILLILSIFLAFPPQPTD
jgi:hypothetical protein